MKRMKKTVTLLLILAVVFGVFGASAYAAGGPWAVEVEAVYGGAPVEGMTYKLYKIATYDDSETLSFEAAVQALPISRPTKLSDYDDDGWRTFTTTLAAQASELTEAESLSTDSSGKLSFAGAYPQGIYLLLGETLTDGNGKTYTAQPALVQVCALKADASGKVKVNPKLDVTSGPKTVQVVVEWNDTAVKKDPSDPNSPSCDLSGSRPDAVTIELRKDGAVVETVQVTGPGWTHTWDNLDGTGWTVTEIVPDGYTATYSIDGSKTTITNTPDVVWVDPPVRKTVTGSGAPATAKFTFKMEAVSGPVSPIPMPPGSVNGVKRMREGAGSYEFGWFALHEVGTYVYRISEEKTNETNEEGWTYDETLYTKTVVVTRDANGKLQKTETMTDSMGNSVTGEAAAAVFTNSYSSTPGPGPSPNPVSVTLDVSKVLKGSPKTTADFAFRLVGKNGAPMPSGTSGSQKNVKVHGQGNASFGTINFTAPGTYVYEVSEVNDKLSGYTYDTNTYTVTVTVTKNAAGNLTADITAVNSSKQSVKWDELVFTNTYKDPAPQTGILWWPVPVLLAGGLLLVLMGIIRRRKYEN